MKNHTTLKRRWFWFKDTFTGKDLIVVAKVGTYKEANNLFSHLVGPTELDGHGRFEGLHVAMCPKNDPDTYTGSAIFLATSSRSVLAHELIHAVSRNLDYMGIKDEEALACGVSAWMDIIQHQFKLKDL
jgi:hypothetical protein